jgi:hypothetical protein
MATATKKEKKRKEKAYLWKAGASSGHTTNLKHSILRLSISMCLCVNHRYLWCNSALNFLNEVKYEKQTQWSVFVEKGIRQNERKQKVMF